MISRKAVVLSILWVSGYGEADAADRPPAQVVALCAACHRLDRKPNGITPLVSLSAAQIVVMMRNYKVRPDADHIMHNISRSLSDAEIVVAAAYLSSLTTRGQK